MSASIDSSRQSLLVSGGTVAADYGQFEADVSAKIDAILRRAKESQK